MFFLQDLFYLRLVAGECLRPRFVSSVSGLAKTMRGWQQTILGASRWPLNTLSDV
jgi:hypothetical protein